MSIEIIVPRLGWSMEEGAFVAWLKRDGELVRAGEPLFSIEGDKAIQEVESIDSGILRIAPGGPSPGQPVRVGDLLGHLLTAAEARAGGVALAPTLRPASGEPAGEPTGRPSSSVAVAGESGDRVMSRVRRVRTRAGVARWRAPGWELCRGAVPGSVRGRHGWRPSWVWTGRG